jgi:hypothetical protein
LKKSKNWQKPELVVLARQRSEEAVLGGCKGDTTSGPYHYAATCMWTGCPACFTWGAS